MWSSQARAQTPACAHTCTHTHRCGFLNRSTGVWTRPLSLSHSLSLSESLSLPKPPQSSWLARALSNYSTLAQESADSRELRTALHLSAPHCDSVRWRLSRQDTKPAHLTPPTTHTHTPGRNRRGHGGAFSEERDPRARTTNVRDPRPVPPDPTGRETSSAVMGQFSGGCYLSFGVLVLLASRVPATSAKGKKTVHTLIERPHSTWSWT